MKQGLTKPRKFQTPRGAQAASHSNDNQWAVSLVIVPARGTGYIGGETVTIYDEIRFQTPRGVRVASVFGTADSRWHHVTVPVRGTGCIIDLRLLASLIFVTVPVRGTGCIWSSFTTCLMWRCYSPREGHRLHLQDAPPCYGRHVIVPVRGTGCISKSIQPACNFLVMLYKLCVLS